MKRTRRTFTSQLKADVVRRHLSAREEVSDLAEELQVQPSQIHQWVNQVLAQAEKAFDREAKRKGPDPAEKRLSQLEAKLTAKNEVIAELMEENVRAKKANGEL